MYILILSPPFLSEPDHITSNERSGAVPNVCVKNFDSSISNAFAGNPNGTTSGRSRLESTFKKSCKGEKLKSYFLKYSHSYKFPRKNRNQNQYQHLKHFHGKWPAFYLNLQNDRIGYRQNLDIYYHNIHQY